MDLEFLKNSVYIVSAFLFTLGLKKLSSPASARQGNLISAIGMLIAVVVTLLDQSILSYQGILVGVLIGSFVGVLAARMVAMTAMPQMVALLNGFGGISSMLLGWASYSLAIQFNPVSSITIVLSIVIGALTFSGSIVAWAKLAEKVTTRALKLPGSAVINCFLLIAIMVLGVMIVLNPGQGMVYLWILIALSLLLGVVTVFGIGGGDMPVVIALLNSYSGLAACAAGFAIQNLLLIVAGILVGASGLILTNIMCKAMNRSLSNVLFSGFGASRQKQKSAEGTANPVSADDAYLVLEAARSVLIVPGYGMAVAQAQHGVKELAELLQENGAEVNFGIHPVAGRMPGHMNVLLAEADVDYDQLSEMDDVNPSMDTVDVCLVIGANDVVNPDAKEDSSSPIYGMPIIEVSRAKTVFVLKRSMNPGFAGIQNPLFFKDNTRMLFGDAKASIQSLISEFKT